MLWRKKARKREECLAVGITISNRMVKISPERALITVTGGGLKASCVIWENSIPGNKEFKGSETHKAFPRPSPI